MQNWRFKYFWDSGKQWTGKRLKQAVYKEQETLTGQVASAEGKDDRSRLIETAALGKVKALTWKAVNG